MKLLEHTPGTELFCAHLRRLFIAPNSGWLLLLCFCFVELFEVFLSCTGEPEAALELAPQCFKGDGDDGGATAEPWPGSLSKQPNPCCPDH